MVAPDRQQVVFVTGGGSGFGRATALRFAAGGLRSVYHRRPRPGAARRRRQEARGGRRGRDGPRRALPGRGVRPRRAGCLRKRGKARRRDLQRRLDEGAVPRDGGRLLAQGDRGQPHRVVRRRPAGGAGDGRAGGGGVILYGVDLLTRRLAGVRPLQRRQGRTANLVKTMALELVSRGPGQLHQPGPERHAAVRRSRRRGAHGHGAARFPVVPMGRLGSVDMAAASRSSPPTTPPTSPVSTSSSTAASPPTPTRFRQR